MSVAVRTEEATDIRAIHRINVAAFDTDAEATLVDRLRENAGLLLSLVAESDGVLLGHIAFSPVVVHRDRDGGGAFAGVGLGPMAVLPGHQRVGIGARLIEEGLQRLRTDGHPFCVVLGHPGYYPRFGFVRASHFGIRWEQRVPDEAFMVHELQPHGLAGVSGVVRYRPEFDGV